MSVLHAALWALGAAGASVASGSASGTEAHYVDCSLEFEGRLLDWRLVDLSGDDTRELVVALRRPDGERELRVHPVRPSGVAAEAETTVPILKDVVAWSAAEVREEPGRELILWTASGAWSYSLTLPGYRDNVRALARAELIFDVADPRSLPYLGYVLPGEGRDGVLVPGREGYALWGGALGEEFRELVRFPAEDAAASEAEEDTPEDGDGGASGASSRDGDSIEFSLEAGVPTPFLASDFEKEAALLEGSRSYRAPALVQLDGRAGLDLVVRRGDTLAIHLGSGGTLPAEPSRIERLPEALREGNVALEFVDSDLDLLAHVSEEQDELKNVRHQLLLYENDGERLLSEKPRQVLRFEAAVLIVELVDVDGDRRPDLSLRKLELPSFTEMVTGLEFTFAQLLYLHDDGAFERKPVLREERVFDEESITEVLSNRELVMDCDGDGIADLVEIDVEGNLAIRRLLREKGFFSGVTWTLEGAPWKRFDGGGSIESLEVHDVNGDGLGDLFSAEPERLSILVSRRAGGGR